MKTESKVSSLPDFAKDDRTRLLEMGLLEEQLSELRLATYLIRSLIVPRPASRKGVLGILDEVENLARALRDKLAATALQPSSDHSAAFAYLEQQYWKRKADDTGANVAHVLGPRLDALVESVRTAKEEVPREQGRHRKADARGVAWVNDALRRGWRRAHPSCIQSLTDYESEEAMRADGRAMARLNRYPTTLKPSESAKSDFREIVWICYRTAGAPKEPIAAIRNFLAGERKLYVAARAAFDAGVESVRDGGAEPSQ